jgi:two-component system CheB/CheR fusion protein
MLGLAGGRSIKRSRKPYNRTALVTRRPTQTLSRSLRHAIFPTRSDRPSLLSLTGHPSCRAIENGHYVEDFASCEAFLDAYRPGREACLVIDAYLPGMTGLELLKRLGDDGHRLPSIMITGNSDVTIAVQAMKAGAADFIEKPISTSELLGSVGRALEQARDSTKLAAAREDAANRLAQLTPRQREILDMVLAGHPSKNIAADLGISQRTVENHRAAIMDKTGAKSLPALARFALAAAANGSGD